MLVCSHRGKTWTAVSSLQTVSYSEYLPIYLPLSNNDGVRTSLKA